MSGELRVGLDAPLPAELGVGRGSVVLVAGWCTGGRGLRLVIDGAEQPLLAQGMPRDDRRAADGPEAYRSGFWGLARIAATGGPVTIALRDARGAEAPLGTIPVRPREAPAAVAAPGPSGSLVAICMATHDPPSDLLARQLDSIRAQTHGNWVCVISDDRSRPERFAALQQAVGDDPRFVISRSERRRGFYGNFERALELAPREAAHVALADQDDAWDPDKLATLLGAIGDARLAYSDARIVSREGEPVSETFWDRRRNVHHDLFSQLVANAITGAASLFPRDLLDAALPFPPPQWRNFHDHWLGLVALAQGEIAYVDRPLYDYVQHRGATIGHEAANVMPTLRDRLAALRREGPRRRVRLWRRHYFVDALRLLALAETLRLRVGTDMPSAKRRALERYAAAERSPRAVARLFGRGARELARRRPQTLGAEWMLAHAFLWRRLAGRARGLDALPPEGLGTDVRRAAETLPADVAGIADKVAPLALRVADVAPRVNVLVPALDLRHFFGGYIAKLNLALRLARRGARVRVLATDTVAMLPEDWRRAREAIEGYAGLEGFFDAVEVGLGRAPGGVEVSAEDRFVATTWWTAHIAQAARRELGGPPFVYLVQEYEPFTFPHGTWRALAEHSYRLEHRALYSTDLLRDWFAARGLAPQGALAFANAITPARPSGALHRRLLFYARPEPHAARNLYELGMLALREVVADGTYAGWALRGIGTTSLGRAVRVGDATLELLERTDQRHYAALLCEHDVGLALMHTPHPSLVPIEMAAAGLATVTSTYANKTASALRAISPNLLAAEPTVDGVAAALREARERAEDLPARAAGAAATAWPATWERALPDALIDKVLRWLRA